MLEATFKKIVAVIPGTRLNLAQQKRQMDRDLRAAGHSCRDAKRLVATHFQSNSK